MGSLQVDHVAQALEYAREVVEGRIPACKWVKAACQRQLDDLERWTSDANWPFAWSADLADRAIRYVELQRHVKGRWGGELLALEPWQKFCLACVFGWVRKDDGSRRFRTVYEEVPRKNAKALALDTPIATPSGFKPMRDLVVGDLVLDADGRPTRVTAESPVFVGRKCFEVQFSTGERIVCDAEHLWVVRSRRTGNRGGRALAGMTREQIRQQPKVRSRTTAEIAATLRAGGRGDTNHFVKVAGALQLDERDLPIAPYTLGAWLGDGHSDQPRITSADSEIVERIAELEGEVRLVANAGNRAPSYAIGRSSRNGCSIEETLRRRLVVLGVLGNKHIPQRYLRAGPGQRLELLRGLMDTDGSVSPRGQCTYSSMRHELALDVMELVASLGGKPTLNESVAKIGERVIGPAWKVQFWPDPARPPFHLARKRSRVREGAKAPRRHYRGIVSVVEVASVPTKCIAVESATRQFLVGRSLIPTHNTTKLAAIGLYMLTADDELGAEVYSAATTRDQAKIVFEIAQQMGRSDGLFRARFGVEVLTHAILCKDTGSKFVPLSAEGSTLDGLNVSCALIDELHAHKTRAVHDVLDSATGSRRQPLIWKITTAGSNRSGVCYDQRTYLTKILNAVLKRHGGMGYDVKGNAVDDDAFWGIIYTVDEGDDEFAEATWRKANPNYGISVDPLDLQRMAAVARVQAASLAEFKTKRLNVWVNADSAWMNMLRWDACADPTLAEADFRGHPCWIALDAAFKKDLFAKVRVFQDGDGFVVFGRYYMPEAEVQRRGNEQLAAWAREGWIRTTPGEVLDIEAVREELAGRADGTLEGDLQRFEIVECGFDPAQITQFATEMLAQGLPMVEIRPLVLHFSPAMKELEELVMAKRLRHNGDPVLSWMIANVVCHRDAKDNIYPRKERAEDKIDGAVALIMALSRLISAQPDEQSFWETQAA